MERRLAAILVADVVGYTHLMEQNEGRTLDALKKLRSHILEPAFSRHGGRLVKLVGDGVIVEFGSTVKAVESALEVQRTLADGARWPDALMLRIGIHVSDLIVEGDDIYGEGVNLAARLEAASPPGGICLSGTVAEQVRGRVEAELVELEPLHLKNISQPVRAFTVAGLGLIAKPPVASIAKSQADRPSIAILNFLSKGGEPGTETLSQGITEDLIASLSRFRDLFVIAHRSSRRFDAATSDPKEIADQLGVRYLVEGSIRWGAGQIRLTVHVMDTQSGASLWSERFDREASDLFALQDEVVEAIVRTLFRKISSAEVERLHGSRPEGLREYELVLQARTLVADTPQKNDESRKLYLAAIEQSPNYAKAWAGLSGAYLLDWTSGWAEDPDATLAKAREAASKSLQLDPADSEAHRRMGLATLMSRDFSSAEHHLKRSVELNPNAASGWIYLGLFSIYDGKPKDALDHMAKAMRHDPFHDSYYFWFLGLALFGALRYEEATVPLKQAILRQAGFVAPHRHLAACYGMLGQANEAAAERNAILELDPDFRISKLAKTLVYRDRKALEHYLEGLRRAGIPE